MGAKSGDAPAPDWDDFRLFAAVVRAGSFTRAARELKVSEPTISRRIKRLEDLVGARLFDRGSGAPRLTGEGRRVLDYASAAEHSLARAVSTTREAARRIDGDCSLVTGEGIGGYWMPAFIAPFFQQYPFIDVRLFTSQALTQDHNPAFDIQIQYVQPLETKSIVKRLGTMHFLLYASQTYLERFGTPQTMDDLRNHRIADSSSALAARGSLMSWTNINKDLAFTTNSNLLLAETVRAGSAIGLLATYSSAIHPELVPILTHVNFSSPIFLCFERENGLKPAVRAMIDYLKTHVFDTERMPWFADGFVLPQKAWRGALDGCIADAAYSR